MQDVVNKINKMNRVLSHLLWVYHESGLSSQVIVCTITLGVGFHRQTRRKIK